MPAPATIDELLDLSQKSGIIDKKGLDEYLQRMRGTDGVPAAPEALAEAMVRDGLLTRFQAEQLLQGKWRNFLISNKFKLLERLGEGGMGAVFLCEHVNLRRRVALKVLPAPVAQNPGAVDRFYREGRAVATLDHPNIIKVYDIDFDGKLHYLVMEFAAGSTLQDIVKKKGPMDFVRAAHYIAQAALGLQHAHEGGLVHRDVKPGNILLDRDGTIKVLDLGLARFFNDQGDNLTREHDATAILGTADYLAPEQAINSHTVDVRADIYSLGMTFYYLLTGSAPFADGTLNQKLIWHQVRQPEPIAGRRPDVPAELAAVLERMIAKDPAERFQTPAAVVEALAPWVQDAIEPPPADEMPELSLAALGSAPATSGPGSGAPATRRRATITAAGLAALRASPGIRGGLPVDKTLSPSTDPNLGVTVPVAPSDLLDRRAREPGVDWDNVFFWGRISAYVLLVAGSAAGLAWWAFRDRGVKVIEKTEDLDKPPVVINNPGQNPNWKPPFPAIPKLNLNTLGFIATLKGHTREVERVAFAPDGKLAVSCSHDRVAILWDMATGQRRHTLSGHSDVVHDVVFAPDGKRVLTGSYDRTLRLWDTTSGRQTALFKGHDAQVRAVAFSADGKRILSGAGEVKPGQPSDCTLRLWDITGKQLKRFDGHTNAVWSVAFSPDGRRVASGSYDGSARVWDTGTGKELCRFETPGKSIHGVAFAPDGRRVASAGSDRKIHVWSAGNAREELVLAGHTGTVGGVAFSPDGRYLLSGSDDRSMRLWDAHSGTAAGTFLGHDRGIWGVCFAPDGRLALSAGSDATVRLWGLPPFVQVIVPGENYNLRAHAGKVLGVAVSGAGRFVLSCGDDRTARLRPLDAAPATPGNGMRQFQGHTGAVNAVALAPDGTRLATASDDHTVRLWDTHKGTELRRLTAGGAVHCVTFTPDGRFVLAGGDDRIVHVWEAASGKPAKQLQGHTGAVNGVAVSPDGRLVLAAGGDGTVRIWELATAREVVVFKEHTAAVRTVAFSPDGAVVLSAGNDKVVRLWEAATGKGVRVIPMAGEVTSATFTADGRRVLAVGNGVAGLWDVGDGKLLQAFSGQVGVLSGVVGLPDGRRAVTCGHDSILRVWGLTAVDAGRVVGEVRRFEGQGQSIDRLCVSPDGRQAVSVGLGKKGDAVLWEVASGLQIRRYPHNTGLRWAAFAPDGRQFVTCAEDGKVYLWDVATGKEVRRFEGHKGIVWTAAFTAKGSRLLTGGADKTVRLWDVATGKELKRFTGHQGDINSVAATADGKVGVSASWDRTVRVWDLETGEEKQCFRGHTAEVRAVALAPDGKHAVSAGSDKVLRLWEVESGKPVRDFVGHSREVYFVAFSPDGQRLVSSGVDRAVRLWDVAGGRVLHVFGGHAGSVTAVMFAPDGWHALSSSHDQTLRLWSLPGKRPTEPISYEEEREGRACVRKGQWAEAVRHFGRIANPSYEILVYRGFAHEQLGQADKAAADFTAAAQEQDGPGLWSLRGRLYLGAAQWDRAAAAFKRVLELQPGAATERTVLRDYLEVARGHAARREWGKAAAVYAVALERHGGTFDGHAAFEYACVLLLTDDVDGYRKVCGSLLERCAKGGSGIRPYHLARVWTLAPGAPGDLQRVENLARGELQGSAAQFWSLTEQGALHDRAVRFVEAVPLFEQSLKANPKPGAAVLNWLWLALAQQRLGKSEEARKWLNTVGTWLEQFPQGKPVGEEQTLGLDLHNWLEAHVLRKEAESLLGK